MINYNGKKFKKFISNQRIKKTIKDICYKINSYYGDKEEIIIICVLNGSVMLLSEMLNHLTVKYKVDYIKISSYKGDTKSSGKIELIQDIALNAENKKILIIEDIVDSGSTLNYLYNKFNSMNCNDVKVFSLLVKPTKYKYSHKIDWYGMNIDDIFVLGYGMDYNFKFRGLLDIYYMLEN